jgi:hypothetical protein
LVTELDSKYIGCFPTPIDSRKYTKEINGCCGQCAIAAITGKMVKDIFAIWGKKEKDFRHYTSQKEMQSILEMMGLKVKQKPAPDKDKITFPRVDLAVVRVTYADLKEHWTEIARNSHYLGLKRFGTNYYVFDNFTEFDGKETNGIWIELSEYYKVLMHEKGHITSYLELKKK